MPTAVPEPLPGSLRHDSPARCCLRVLQERISFNPHPKTLTMAGDYEYFAAQGYHPLAFALAELVDNALRATKGNTDRPRSIAVSLITDDSGSKGMVCVRDNGSGMSTQELNNWAVMNLSMEDRGLLNNPAAADKGEAALGGVALVAGSRRAERPPRAELVLPTTTPTKPCMSPLCWHTRALSWRPLPEQRHQLLWRGQQERRLLPRQDGQGGDQDARQRVRARAVHPG
jgi:hypothetical protein